MKISKKNLDLVAQHLKDFQVGPAWFAALRDTFARELQKRDDKIKALRAEIKALKACIEAVLAASKASERGGVGSIVGVRRFGIGPSGHHEADE